MNLEEATEKLTCSQCGQKLSDRACGPTHAMLAADPIQHRRFLEVFDLLTEEEHHLMDLTGELTQGLLNLCGEAQDDAAEVAADIHRIQYRILAQAASRVYPDRYRPMGP